jgi:transposase-like protein
MSRGYVNATPAIAAVAAGNSISAMLQDPGITVLEVARRLGVAASTLYRHLPRARTAALDA